MSSLEEMCIGRFMFYCHNRELHALLFEVKGDKFVEYHIFNNDSNILCSIITVSISKSGNLIFDIPYCMYEYADEMLSSFSKAFTELFSRDK